MTEDTIIHPELKPILQRIPIQIFAVDPEFREAVDRVNRTLWITNNVLIKSYIMRNFQPSEFECQETLFIGNWIPKIAKQLENKEIVSMIESAEKMIQGLNSETCLVCGHQDGNHETYPEEQRIYCTICKKDCIKESEETE